MQALMVLTAPAIAFACHFFSLPPFTWLLILPVIYLADRVMPKSEHPKPIAPTPARLTLLAGVAVHLLLLLWGMHELWARTFDLASLSLLTSLAVLCFSSSSAPVGHELIHKRSALEKWSGNLVFNSICFPTFNIEHLRGHHVYSGTPLDADTADKGQNYYRFVLRTVPLQFKRGVELEAIRLSKAGLGFWHWKNELLRHCGVSALILVLMLALFDLKGLLIYLVYSALAICSLEMIQYMSHYGLKRKNLPGGGYAKMQRLHSWNSNGGLTDLLSVSIQKHSAHHEMPSEYFSALDIDQGSSLLPFSYYLMFAVALFPPLWFKIMDPRVEDVMARYEAETG